MGRPVKKRSSPEQPKLCINENPEQPESSRSKRVRKSEQLGSGKKMVDIQGKTKFKASYPQGNKGGGRRQAGIKAGNNDRKIQLEISKLRRQCGGLEKANGDLVKENERLKSTVTTVKQLIEQMERQKNFMIDALVPRTQRKRLVTKKSITPGTRTSQTKVLESDIKQIQVKLMEIRANNKQLKSDNAILYSELIDLVPHLESLKVENKIPCNEDLATNKHVTAGRGTDPQVTSTCLPTSSTSSSGFMSYIRWFFFKFGTQLGTALVNRLATALVKHMEDFLAS